MAQMKRRNRDREGAGRNPHSWIKHDLLKRVIRGQVGVALKVWPQHRILLIDGNAGDGEGVVREQMDFLTDNRSMGTADLLVEFAEERDNIDVLLCEKDDGKRQVLESRFPDLRIIDDHADAPRFVPGYDHVLWLSDPCGPSTHGLDAMATVAELVPTADFVIVLNVLALLRIWGTTSDIHRASREQYPKEMLEPEFWANRLCRRHVGKTHTVHKSRGFHYHILVVSNYLSEAARRGQFEVAA